MGQGTESCGGYEVIYDPISEGLERGEWNTRNGGSISVNRMTKSHLRNAIRHAEKKSICAGFSDESEDWDEWVSVLESELSSRQSNKPPGLSENLKSKFPVRGKKKKMKCHCGTIYEARQVDLKRGWAKSCSKSCAAIRREYGKPAATEAATNQEA